MDSGDTSREWRSAAVGCEVAAPEKSYAGSMRQWERGLAVGLLVAAAAVMSAYYLGFIAVSVAFPVGMVLAVSGGVGLSSSKRRSKPTSI
jgi:hypothetical protein